MGFLRFSRIFCLFVFNHNFALSFAAESVKDTMTMWSVHWDQNDTHDFTIIGFQSREINIIETLFPQQFNPMLYSWSHATFLMRGYKFLQPCRDTGSLGKSAKTLYRNNLEDSHFINEKVLWCKLCSYSSEYCKIRIKTIKHYFCTKYYISGFPW